MESSSRQTRQKEAVSQLLRQERDFVSAQKLYLILHKAGQHVGLATVYRQLNDLADSGDVDTIEHKGQLLYRLCEAQRKHHHHLVCESCGKTIEIEPPDEDWINSLAAAQGFRVSSHIMEVYGTCADCQAKAI